MLLSMESVNAYRKLKELRQHLLDSSDSKAKIVHLKTLITIDSIRKEAASFKQATSIGADNLAFKDINGAPEEGFSELKEIFHEMLDRLALPEQALLNIMALLGKKGRRKPHYCGLQQRIQTLH